MTQSADTKFSIIIVSWNTNALTEKCLASVYEKNRTGHFEVIVVDNASSDGSPEMIKRKFPHVTLIRNEENVGFSKANNQAIRIAQGEFILLLNSDAELLTMDCLDELYFLFEQNKQYGIFGAVQYLPNGSIQSIGRTFQSLRQIILQQLFFPRLLTNLKQRYKLRNRHLKTDYVDGAFLAIRKKVIDEIGLMQESFFMYGEDMEWCSRAAQAGWIVGVAANIKILHHRGASSKQNFKRSLVENAQNITRFISQHQSLASAKVAYDVLLFGMALRIPLSILRRNSLAKQYATAFSNGLQQRRKFRKQLEAKP